MVKEYKKLDDFKPDTTKARADTYLIGFANCKDKVAQTCLELVLSNILAVRAMLKEEEERVLKEEGARIEKLVAKGVRPEVTVIEGPIAASKMIN